MHKDFEMIDLRSDVLGPPSKEALEALVSAASDRPGFVRHEDQHQERLEREMAKLFGFEAAAYVPTGTLANQIAIRVWCRPGETLVAEAESHVAINEAAATAGLNSVALRLVAGEHGHPSPAAVEAVLACKSSSSAADRGVGLMWLENTHNRAGGTVMPAKWQKEIASLSTSRGIPLHIDGARIWHAAVASGTSLSEAAQGGSSLSVCLGKGIGAPIGALVLGTAAFIDEAVQVQKMYGGLWRPAGPLAAAAFAAVLNRGTRIEISHERAREFASTLSRRVAGQARVPTPQTNIVMLELGSNTQVQDILEGLSRRGVRASPYGRNRLRFVLNGSITQVEVDQAAEHVAAEVELSSAFSK